MCDLWGTKRLCLVFAFFLLVILEHSGQRNAEALAKAREDVASLEKNEKEREEDSRRWAMSSLKQYEMCRLVSCRFDPLTLGPPGRQKGSEIIVSNVPSWLGGARKLIQYPR